MAELLDKNLLNILYDEAEGSTRLRMNYDLRTSPEDSSQRMLNAMLPGTKVPIHKHDDTSETAICLEGCLDWIIYEEIKNPDGESSFRETERIRVCPREQKFGVQVPVGAWHSVEVYEKSTIFEAKDGAYKP